MQRVEEEIGAPLWRNYNCCIESVHGRTRQLIRRVWIVRGHRIGQLQVERLERNDSAWRSLYETIMVSSAIQETINVITPPPDKIYDNGNEGPTAADHGIHLSLQEARRRTQICIAG